MLNCSEIPWDSGQQLLTDLWELAESLKPPDSKPLDLDKVSFQQPFQPSFFAKLLSPKVLQDKFPDFPFCEFTAMVHTELLLSVNSNVMSILKNLKTGERSSIISLLSPASRKQILELSHGSFSKYFSLKYQTASLSVPQDLDLSKYTLSEVFAVTANSRTSAVPMSMNTTAVPSIDSELTNKKEDFQKRSIIIDRLHPKFKGKLLIAEELAIHAPQHLVRHINCLDGGGVQIVFERAESAEAMINTDILKNAFGGNIKISRTAKYRSLFPSSSEDMKEDETEDELKVITFDFPLEVEPDSLHSGQWQPFVKKAWRSKGRGQPMFLIMSSIEHYNRITNQGIPWLVFIIRGKKPHVRNAATRSTRCRFCQSHSHTTHDCCITAPICQYCAGNHFMADCDKATAVKKCINCGGPHTANFGGCKYNKEEISKNQNTIRSKINFIVEKQFPPLPVAPGSAAGSTQAWKTTCNCGNDMEKLKRQINLLEDTVNKLRELLSSVLDVPTEQRQRKKRRDSLPNQRPASNISEASLQKTSAPPDTTVTPSSSQVSSNKENTSSPLISMFSAPSMHILPSSQCQT